MEEEKEELEEEAEELEEEKEELEEKLEEIEEEKRLREKAVDDGVDVEEFDGGDWAEVKSKKNKRPAGRHRKRGEEDGISMESLGI